MACKIYNINTMEESKKEKTSAVCVCVILNRVIG